MTERPLCPGHNRDRYMSPIDAKVLAAWLNDRYEFVEGSTWRCEACGQFTAQAVADIQTVRISGVAGS